MSKAKLDPLYDRFIEALESNVFPVLAEAAVYTNRFCVTLLW